MNVAIEFLSGRIKEYNMSTLCASDPWSDRQGGDFVCCMEFDLRTDILERTGQLRVDYVRHVTNLSGASEETVELDEYVDEQGRPARLAAAMRVPSVSVVLADERELQNASLIRASAAGSQEVVAWRQGHGNWLINGIRFASARREYYTDSMMTSTTSQALRLEHYLRGAYPDLTREEVAYSIGFPPDALDEAREMELRNAGGLSEEGAQGRDDLAGPDGPGRPAGEPDSIEVVDDSKPLVDLSALDDEDDEDE